MKLEEQRKNLLEKKRSLDNDFKNKAYVKLYSEILEEYLKKDIKVQEQNKEIIEDLISKLK